MVRRRRTHSPRSRCGLPGRRGRKLGPHGLGPHGALHAPRSADAFHDDQAAPAIGCAHLRGNRSGLRRAVAVGDLETAPALSEGNLEVDRRTPVVQAVDHQFAGHKGGIGGEFGTEPGCLQCTDRPALGRLRQPRAHRCALGAGSFRRAVRFPRAVGLPREMDSQRGVHCRHGGRVRHPSRLVSYPSRGWPNTPVSPVRETPRSRRYACSWRTRSRWHRPTAGRRFTARPVPDPPTRSCPLLSWSRRSRWRETRR